MSLKKYIQAGATEFYCGVIDNTWLDTYNYIVPLNRRPWPEANFRNFNELSEAIEIAHSYGHKIFYTLNEHCYNVKQYPLLMKHIDKIIKLKVDAIIVANLGIIELIREMGYCGEIHISTGGITFNSSAVDFYKEKFNIDRIVLPRALSIQEINKITDLHQNIDFEIFMKNEGCTFIDGVCNFIHGVQFIEKDNIIYNPPCEIRYDIINIDNNIKPEFTRRLNRIQNSKANCGICALYLFNRNKITSLKIVSRDSATDAIVRDIKHVKKAIQLCDECASFSDYRNIIRHDICQNDYQNKRIYCYYPEVIDKNEL